MCLFEGVRLDVFGEERKGYSGPPRSKLRGLVDEELHVLVDVIAEVAILEIGAEKCEELLDDGLFVLAEPWTVVDEDIGTVLCLKVFGEDLEEGGLAESVGFVDIDDERAVVCL